MAPATKKDHTDNPLRVFAITAAKSLIFTFLWIPVYSLRCLLVYFIAKCKPNYGKIMDHIDSTVEEEYTLVPPKNSLIFTMILDAPITLSELRQLFIRNVLEAKIQNKKGDEEFRFREFKQYCTDLAGYKFWKDDPTFNINNHITELPYSAKFKNIAKIHTDMTNKLYAKKRSPWDIILINNYKNDASKAMLIYRSHHTLADTKSVLKVLVEGLGEKPLALPNAQYKGRGLSDKIQYYALMPFYFVYSQVYLHYIGLKADSCPLKYKREDETLLNVGISKPILMTDIKAIAKKNNVTTSAVIMAAIAGGVAKIDGRLAKQEIPCQWVLPKENHPDKLANYSYSGTMRLPTDISSPLDRLRKCQEIFMYLKSSNLYKYDKSVLFQTGTWFNPLRVQWLKNTTFPLILTNIAGEGQGFSIGSSPVSEFTMTCAPLPGACGVIICGFSYKNVIELSATAKDGTLNDVQTQKLADLMGKEFEILKRA